MLRSTGQWQGNRTPDNQAANKLVDAGGIWFEDVGSTPTASIFSSAEVGRGDRFRQARRTALIDFRPKRNFFCLAFFSRDLARKRRKNHPKDIKPSDDPLFVPDGFCLPHGHGVWGGRHQPRCPLARHGRSRQGTAPDGGSRPS